MWGCSGLPLVEVVCVASAMICTLCGADVQIGQWPAEMCRGRSINHGPLTATKTSVFPFDTFHIAADGRPMTITDIGHLRRVERAYGVVLSAFSNEPSNPSNIKDPPRYRGEHPDHRRR